MWITASSSVGSRGRIWQIASLGLTRKFPTEQLKLHFWGTLKLQLYWVFSLSLMTWPGISGSVLGLCFSFYQPQQCRLNICFAPHWEYGAWYTAVPPEISSEYRRNKRAKTPGRMESEKAEEKNHTWRRVGTFHKGSQGHDAERLKKQTWVRDYSSCFPPWSSFITPVLKSWPLRWFCLVGFEYLQSPFEPATTFAS